MTNEQLKQWVLDNIRCGGAPNILDTDRGNAPDILEADCDISVFVLDNCEITVPEENTFFVATNCLGVHNRVVYGRNWNLQKLIDTNGLRDGTDALAFTGNSDFSHTCPEWHNVIGLGFVGLKKRVEEYSAKNSSDPHKKRFYTQTLRLYDAIFRFLRRAADTAERCGKRQMAAGLRNLTEHPPRTMFEAMQTSIAYYFFHCIVEGTYLRTLGRLDRLFYPFYQPENKETARQLTLDFLNEIDRLEAPANIPFAICGTDLAGVCVANDMTYILLDAYRRANTTNTKFHILYSEDMPKDILRSGLESIREGKNSIVFLSDKKCIEMLEQLGADHEDAVDYHIVGCYEPGSNNELASTCNGRVNIPKALEYALFGGKDLLTGKQVGQETSCDFSSYEALYGEFCRQLQHLCRCAMQATDLHEANYKCIHSSPLFSSTYTSALEQGGDIYCDYAAKYCNSSINGIGLATATDALVAIKKLVFEDKTISLAQLRKILVNDWAGEEVLRLQVKNSFPKYGMGDQTVDAIAADLVQVMSDVVYKKPNVKGGVYRLGLISIDWRWEFGEKTAASADGRHAGETLSQNIRASVGADRNGPTSLLLSTAAIDYCLVPNGTVVDIDLHSSAVQGENGLCAMIAMVNAYFAMGGFAVHINVLNTDVLMDARLHPEKHPTLQVRLCGWNVLFSSLSDKEKDEFIARSIQ